MDYADVYYQLYVQDNQFVLLTEVTECTFFTGLCQQV